MTRSLRLLPAMSIALATIGCADPAPSPPAASKQKASEPEAKPVAAGAQPTGGALKVRRVTEAESFLRIAAAGQDHPPETVAFDFQGGHVLLHLVVYRDDHNRRASSDFLAEAPEGELVREIRGSFMIGPLPNGYEPLTVDTQVHRRALLMLESDHVRLAVEDSATRPPAATAATWYWKSLSYGSRERPPFQRAQVKDHLAVSQYALKPYISSGPRSRTTAIAPEETVEAGKSERVFWLYNFNDVQTALIAECLPLAPASEVSMRHTVEEMKTAVQKAPEDRVARYRLAWAYYFLLHRPGIKVEEAQDCIGASVKLLTRLAREEPANLFVRHALRAHLLVHLKLLARESDQLEPTVAAFLELQPVFDEALSAAQIVLRADRLAPEEKAKQIANLLSHGLSMSGQSPALTQAHLRQYESAFAEKHLRGWSMKTEHCDLIKAAVQPFAESSSRGKR